MSPQKMSKQKEKQVKCKRLSRTKLDSLRAQGKFFNFQQMGHEQRNCPELNSMRPPELLIKAGVINLIKMDRLTEQKEKANIYFGQISMMVLCSDLTGI